MSYSMAKQPGREKRVIRAVSKRFHKNCQLFHYSISFLYLMLTLYLHACVNSVPNTLSSVKIEGMYVYVCTCIICFVTVLFKYVFFLSCWFIIIIISLYTHYIHRRADQPDPNLLAHTWK